MPFYSLVCLTIRRKVSLNVLALLLLKSRIDGLPTKEVLKRSIAIHTGLLNRLRRYFLDPNIFRQRSVYVILPRREIISRKKLPGLFIVLFSLLQVKVINITANTNRFLPVF